MFLKPEELIELTGYKQAAKQTAMLRRQGIPFHVNAAGQPKVARAMIEGMRQPKADPPTWSPRWADTRV